MINLTQHPASPEQLAEGVRDLPPEAREELKVLLTFEEIPTAGRIDDRALGIARIARGTGDSRAMIGGAPFLMGALERELRWAGIVPFYAFSRRESAEADDGEGGVRKVTVFRHLGFVEAWR